MRLYRITVAENENENRHYHKSKLIFMHTEVQFLHQNISHKTLRLRLTDLRFVHNHGATKKKLQYALTLDTPGRRIRAENCLQVTFS